MQTTTLKKPHDSELALFRRAQGGDFSSFQQLIHELHPRVYSLARRIVRQNQDAEDVTQQTFLSLIENIERFQEKSSVSTWVLKIALHHALKVLRKKTGIPLSQFSLSHFSQSHFSQSHFSQSHFSQSHFSQSQYSHNTAQEHYADIPFPEFIAPWSETPEALAQQAETRLEIERALDQLSEKYRVVFILRDIEGLSVREAAEVLELSESNVKVRLLRARLFLRERLTRRFGDENQRMIPPKPDSFSPSHQKEGPK